MEELRECPFCGEYLVRTQNSYTNKHGEKCKEDYYSHDVLKNPEYCLAEEICVSNNLKDITAWNTRPDNWISVKERLPEGTKGVLVWEPICKNIYTMYWEDNEWRFFGGRGKTYYNITHWMPLPEPPKGSE